MSQRQSQRVRLKPTTGVVQIVRRGERPNRTQLLIGVARRAEEHLAKFQTHAMTTLWQIPTDSVALQKKLNVLSCLPTWVQTPSPGSGPRLTNFSQDGTKLKLVYTTGLYNVVNDAMAAWKAVLIAAGRTNFDYERAVSEVVAVDRASVLAPAVQPAAAVQQVLLVLLSPEW